MTYVRVEQKRAYVFFLVVLFNREIIGYSAGPNKDAALVHKAFASLEQLSPELSDYVNWFNNVRIHSSLDYLSPVEYKLDTLKISV